jgi:hypothetical protein
MTYEFNKKDKIIVTGSKPNKLIYATFDKLETWFNAANSIFMRSALEVTILTKKNKYVKLNKDSGCRIFLEEHIRVRLATQEKIDRLVSQQHLLSKLKVYGT